MGKCLITKLNGSVQNDSLLCIGEFVVKVSKVESPSANSQCFVVQNSKDAQLRIIGDGYFTNNTLSENKGKVMNIAANTETLVYFSNGDYEIAVSDKYSLKEIGTYTQSSWRDFRGKLTFDIGLLKYSPATSIVALSNTQISGDIAVLDKLVDITHLTLSNTWVSGDIAVLSKLTKLQYLTISSTKVTGDIAVLGKLHNLSSLPSVAYTNVSGDIAVYRNYTNSIIEFNNTNVYGDLSILPNSVLFVRGHNNGVFTWTGIKNRVNILATEACKCDNIDSFLNDMATLEAKFAGEETQYKAISLIGTRTSASDAAVQTLQSKGYTVSITPA